MYTRNLLQGGGAVNILLVHCHYRLAGGEDAVFAAERAMLEAHGHNVTVYERSNEWHGPAKALLPLTALWNPAAVRQVRRLIRQRQIELVHVHNTLLAVSPAVFWAARAEGVPAVLTLHNFRLFCPNGILLRDGHVCEDCPRGSLWCAVRHRCYRGSRAQSLICAAIYGLHRRLGTYRRVTMIALTDFDRDKLLAFNARKPMFDSARLYVRANPVQAEAPLPGPAAVKNQVVYAGRLEELKGLRTVIEAWELLGPQAPRLLVAGEGPLTGWAKAHAGPQVVFAGRMEPAALHRAMAESRAVVAASLCYESFALVPAEAHMLGVPVLASRIGNVGAAVTDGVDGLHFAPGDAADLADAVRRLDTAAFDRAAIRAAARRRYGQEENYRALMEIYEAARQP